MDAAVGDDGGGGSKTLTVGVLAPLDAGLTQFGRGIRNSVELAVDEASDADLLPGWKLEVVAVDDSSDPGRRQAATPHVCSTTRA